MDTGNVQSRVSSHHSGGEDKHDKSRGYETETQIVYDARGPPSSEPANSQVLIAIAITPPQPDPQISRNLALSSAVVTLFAILAAMALSSAEFNAPNAVADRRLEKGIKLFALGITLVAFVLFVTAIATIRS
ncbi:hypothetical protein FRC00_004723 [Tulasnella sp. 408]|nr:hypothetical protein FRC00_004723 [Tulasnella sp. 408]